MTIKEMLTEEFAEQYGDLDIYNDVTDSMAPCFCGPIELTDEGKEYFKNVLELDIEVNDCCAAVLVDDYGDSWSRAWGEAREFFSAAAGYCSESNYKRWFKEV